MNNYDYLSSIFAEHVELHSQCASETISALSLAGEAVANSLLNDKKVLSAGTGNGDVVAQLFCSYLINGHQEERPALPAIHLRDSNTSQHGSNYISKQLVALGQEGDQLVLFPSSQNSAAILAAIQCAKERNIHVIVCTSDNSFNTQHGAEHIIINLPDADPMRSLEMQITAIHCLCQLVDNHIFGGIPPQ